MKFFKFQDKSRSNPNNLDPKYELTFISEENKKQTISLLQHFSLTLNYRFLPGVVTSALLNVATPAYSLLDLNRMLNNLKYIAENDELLSYLVSTDGYTDRQQRCNNKDGQIEIFLSDIKPLFDITKRAVLVYLLPNFSITSDFTLLQLCDLANDSINRLHAFFWYTTAEFDEQTNQWSQLGFQISW